VYLLSKSDLDGLQGGLVHPKINIVILPHPHFVSNPQRSLLDDLLFMIFLLHPLKSVCS